MSVKEISQKDTSLILRLIPISKHVNKRFSVKDDVTRGITHGYQLALKDYLDFMLIEVLSVYLNYLLRQTLTWELSDYNTLSRSCFHSDDNTAGEKKNNNMFTS